VTLLHAIMQHSNFTMKIFVGTVTDKDQRCCASSSGNAPKRQCH